MSLQPLYSSEFHGQNGGVSRGETQRHLARSPIYHIVMRDLSKIDI
jgi:hypothetical protein